SSPSNVPDGTFSPPDGEVAVSRLRRAEGAAQLAERLWTLQPVLGGKRRATRPDVLKALRAALGRGGDADQIEAAFAAYYSLEDCRRDGGKYAKGAASLLHEDRWRDFLPDHATAPPGVDPAREAEIRRRMIELAEERATANA
ncbi:MAG TPA: hypothetical protein VLT57_02815, partial [Bryobacteraceae bacterium]|nr:hypothetical protein [Bryobacteraceae bacterium]